MSMFDKFRDNEAKDSVDNDKSIFNSRFTLDKDHESYYVDVMHSSTFDFRDPLLRQNADDNIVEITRVATKLDDKDENGNEQWVLTDQIIFDMQGREVRKTEPVLENNQKVGFHEVLLKMGLFENENILREELSTEESLERRKESIGKSDGFGYEGSEYFVMGAYLENFVFDENFLPTKLEKGQIITKGIFMHTDLIEAQEIREENEKNPKALRHIEKGMLSEAFGSIPKSRTNLDDALNKHIALSNMDEFIGHLEFVEKSLEGFIENSKDGVNSTAQSYKESAFNALNEANESLENLSEQLIDIKPFEKMTAQVELYICMIYSKAMMDATRNGNLTNVQETAIKIKEQVDIAEELYKRMGASSQNIDRVKGFVNSPEELSVPKELTNFIDRYKQRSNLVKQKMKKNPSTARVKNVANIGTI